jgi:alkylation response protein AidB-like acyl-CoA dehydrogenase
MGAPTASPILSEALLQRFRERAPGYDRDNRFFQEDFDELRQAGYLDLAVPRELGGRGFTFAECMREQRRLGYYAHATALAMNMHLYWSALGMSVGAMPSATSRTAHDASGEAGESGTTRARSARVPSIRRQGRPWLASRKPVSGRPTSAYTWAHHTRYMRRTRPMS